MDSLLVTLISNDVAEKIDEGYGKHIRAGSFTCSSLLPMTAPTGSSRECSTAFDVFAMRSRKRRVSSDTPASPSGSTGGRAQLMQSAPGGLVAA